MSDVILRVSGEVASPQAMTYEDLASLNAEFQIPDVSEFAPSRNGRAVWLQGILDAAGATERAKFLGLHSSHDNFHASIPLTEVRERGFVIYQCNGEPLPREKGGPARFFIRDHAQCKTDEIDECANVKFVDHIELTAEKGFDNRPEDEDEHAKLHQKEQS